MIIIFQGEKEEEAAAGSLQPDSASGNRIFAHPHPGNKKKKKEKRRNMGERKEGGRGGERKITVAPPP